MVKPLVCGHAAGAKGRVYYSHGRALRNLGQGGHVPFLSGFQLDLGHLSCFATENGVKIA